MGEVTGSKYCLRDEKNERQARLQRDVRQEEKTNGVKDEGERVVSEITEAQRAEHLLQEQAAHSRPDAIPSYCLSGCWTRCRRSSPSSSLSSSCPRTTATRRRCTSPG